MFKMKKLLSALLMISLLLSLMAPAAFGDATPAPLSTDYTKYPNSLSLNLKPSEADPKNGTTTPYGEAVFGYLKWIPQYGNTLPSLKDNADRLNWNPNHAGFKFFYNARQMYENSSNPLMFADKLSEEYVPSVTISDGRLYYWFDGAICYLAKDRINILVIATGADYRTDVPRIDFDYVKFYKQRDFNHPQASTFVKLIENFEAAIAAKNAATTPVTTPVVTAAPGLVAHYKFEGNLSDSSGKGHNGSEIGSIAYASGGASGQALKLENGGYVKIPGSESLNLGEQFTLSAWVKLAAEENDVNRYNTVLFKEHPTEPNYFIYKAVASGTHDVRLDIQQLSTGFEPVVGTDGVGSLDLSSKWTMVTWVSDGDTLYVYVDGKLQSSATTGKKEYGTPFSDTIASNLFIGGPKGASAELFNGQIDEVKLFSKALTGSEIKAEYDGVKSGGSHVLQLWIDQYRIVKDNQESAIDSAPVILNGRTMVPVRPVIEAMGGTVAYDPATRKIDLAFKGRTLTLWIDKYEAVVNGQTVTLEVAPTVINGRTMLPLRFAAESLGAGVEWDKTTQKITLKYTQ